MFAYFFVCIENGEVPSQVVRLGSSGTATSASGSRSCGAGSWASSLGARPPNPPTFYYITRSCVLSSLFRKIFFFFFFYYIPPFIISRFGGVCQVFFKNFFKKIFHFFVDFCFLIWYNYYRN